MKSKLTRFSTAFVCAIGLFQAQIGLAYAQQPSGDIAASAEHGVGPAMWRVGDADTKAVLLGSFHILPEGVQWRTPALNAAFSQADIVYFEFDAEAPDTNAKTTQILMTEGFNPAGVTLSDMLNETDAAKLKSVSTELGLPFAAIDPMRPWQAFLVLSVQFIASQGFQPGHGVDHVLMNEARMLGKELRFFETVDDQLALFTGLAPETEKALLELTLRDWDQQAENFNALFEAWLSGDADIIDSQMNADMRQKAPAVYDRLLTERNEAWARDIAKAMSEETGDLLIVVGAAHLVGDDHSVPALLKARGFSVKRITNKADIANADDASPANDNEPTE